LTDPPYNVSRENNLTTLGRRGIKFEWDGTFDQEGWLHLAAKTLMPGGSMIIWNDWKNLGFIAAELTSLGFDVKRDIRYSKSNPMPRNLNRSFVQSGEVGLWAVKKGAKWIFNKRDGISYERGEFTYSVVHDSVHPSKKPDGLFEDLIEILSDPGDLVLDPFAGVGTTALAAQKLDRRHLSFELNQTYFDSAIDRLRAVVPNDTIKQVWS